MWPFHYGSLFTLWLRQSGSKMCCTCVSRELPRIHSTWNLHIFSFSISPSLEHFSAMLISFAPYHFPFSVDISKAKKSTTLPFLVNVIIQWKSTLIPCHTFAFERGARSPGHFLITIRVFFFASNKHSTMNNLLCVLERNNLLYFGVYCVCECARACVAIEMAISFGPNIFFSFHWKLGALLIYNYDGDGKKTIGLYLYLHSQHCHCHRHRRTQHKYTRAQTHCVYYVMGYSTNIYYVMPLIRSSFRIIYRKLNGSRWNHLIIIIPIDRDRVINKLF